MMAQKFNATIYGIDIDKNSIEEAKSNAILNNLKHRFVFINTSIQEFAQNTIEKFDLIVSNPPFFNNSLKPNLQSNCLAKHTDNNLSYNDLLKTVSLLINNSGTFYVIIPFGEKNKFIEIATNHHLFCCYVLNVFPKINKPPHRVVLKFGKLKNDSIEQNLVIEKTNRHEYTEEYMKLTKDFYLHF